MSLGEEGEHVRAKHASSPRGQEWGLPSPGIDAPWLELDESVQIVKPPAQAGGTGGAQPAGLTDSPHGVHLAPRSTEIGFLRSSLPWKSRHVVVAGSLGLAGDFSRHLFPVGAKGNIDFRPTRRRDRVGPHQSGAPHRLLCIFLRGDGLVPSGSEGRGVF